MHNQKKSTNFAAWYRIFHIFVQIKGNPKQLMSNYTAINVWRKSITAIDVAIMFEQFLDIFVQEKKLSRAINVQLHDN